MADMRNRIEFFVYLIGVALFGFFHEPFKAYFGGGIWFAVAGVAYLVALRAIGVGLKKAFGAEEQ
jgi:hypothetical protein